MQSSGLSRRNLLQLTGASATAFATTSAIATTQPEARTMFDDANNFYTSDRVTREKVSFTNQYRMNVAGNLFVPTDRDPVARMPAIIVSHPMGAVKEQSANLYATKMAERGFVTLSIDLPFWGESEGTPRNAVSPDMYAEAFSAAADFLGARPFIDPERIGVIGICGSGAFALSAAKIDPRLKAIATVSMYDHGTLYRRGLGNIQTVEERRQFIADAARQRTVEFAGGETRYTAGAPLELTGNAIGDEFHDFYRTPRGEVTPTGMSPLTTTMPTVSTNVKFLNFYPLEDLEMIAPRPVLFISGHQAHSKEYSEDAYARAAEPKELFWVEAAGHVDLYDRVGLIPFDKLTDYFTRNLATA